MSGTVTTKGFVDDVAEHFADQSGLGYTLGSNFIIGAEVDLTAIPSLFPQRVTLTAFDEGGSLEPDRIVKQRRSIRFLAKGTSAQAATDALHDVAAWFGNNRQFQADSFTVWWQEIAAMPRSLARDQSGSFYASCVLQFLAMSRT